MKEKREKKKKRIVGSMYPYNFFIYFKGKIMRDI